MFRNKPSIASCQEKMQGYAMNWRIVALLSGLVLIGGLALTGFAVHQVNQSTHIAEQMSIQREIDLVETTLKNQFSRPALWMTSTRAFMASDNGVTRTSFKDMVQASHLATHLPGVSSVGFVQKVLPQNLEAYIATERAAGAPDFEVKTTGTPPHLYVLTYSAPEGVNQAGASSAMDLGTDPIEREAIEKAIFTGETTLTRPIRREQDGNREPVLKYFSPIYKNGITPATPIERDTALRGLLCVSMAPQTLLAQSVGTVGSTLNLTLFDSDDPVTGLMLYTNHSQPASLRTTDTRLSATSVTPTFRRSLSIGGRSMTLLISMKPLAGSHVDTIAPISVGLGGASMSLLLASILWILLSGRWRAEAKVNQMSTELNRLAMVMRHTSNAIIITDIYKKITWTNEAFTRITGYTAAEARGQSPGKLLQSEFTNAATIELIRTRLNAAQACQTELKSRAKNGKDYWLNLDIQPMYDTQGQLCGFMAIAIDITDQMLTNEQFNSALRTNDALMRTYHMHAIVSEADKDGLITDVNALFCQISGYSREELIGQNHNILFSGAQSDAFWRAMWSTISSGKPWRGQVCNRAKNGSLYWVDSLIAPMTDEQGEIIKYVSIRTDITATKIAQVELATERKRLQNILRGTDVGTWEWHVPSGEARFNERWAAITGHVLSELEPISIQTWTDMLHPDDLATSRELLIQHFAGTMEYYECEMRMRHAHGHWVWILNRGKFVSKSADWQVEWMAGTIMDITTRKQAEQTIHASEAFLDRVGKIAGVGGWEYNLASETITWSEQTRQIHEVGADYQPTLETALDFYTPQARETLKNAIDTATLTGQYWDLELPFVTHLGRAIWVRTIGEAEYENNKPVRLVGAFQDVTLRRALEEDIRKQNALMQAILTTIPLGISVFDGDLNLVLDNPLFRALLKLPNDLFKGPTTTFESVIRFNAQQGEYGAGNLEQTISVMVERARRPKAHQLERQQSDGKALEIRSAPMPNGGFVTTYSDISQRKQAEVALKKTTGTLESILNSATDVAVIATDMNGIITLFNKGAVRLLGYNAQDVIGHQTSALWHDIEEVKEKAQSISTQSRRQIMTNELLMDEVLVGKAHEWSCIRKDGQRVVVSEMVNLIMDSDYEHRGYLFIAHDITAQKAHEKSLREAMHKAEMASQAKGQFLANMSHEIRTPMNAILGMLKLLQNTTLTPRQLDYATKTEGAAKSLLGLLNDILDFSKVEAGKMTLDPHPFRIDRLMRDLGVILAAYVGKKEIEVLFDIDSAVPRGLIGDSSRLQQILINLGGNAIKFTSSGEVVISVSVVEQLDSKVALKFSVRDSGIGISPENQKHIFDGFSQAEASTTRRFGGTGLGLSICKRLVDLMGGTLLIDSQLDKGSIFHFTLILPVEAAQEDNPVLENQVATTPLRTLVVDDNAMARELMSSMVYSLGWQVDTATSGEEAVALVDAKIKNGEPLYQAIFVDWQMPGMDGWETSLKLRTQIDGQSAPIVVMVTAHGREMLSQRTPEEHALLNGFLVKPVTASMLLDIVMDAKAAMVYPKHAPAIQRTQTKRLQGMRLLVVEDNAINQQIAQELLSAEGASVQLASDGQLGVEAVLAAAPLFDAVLMDIQMPVMDGYTATRTIRRALGSTPLPIIAMTANAMTSDQEACREAGMDDHVGKPFDLNHLVATLTRHVGRSCLSTQTTAPRTDVALPPPANPAQIEEGSKPVIQGIDVEGAMKRMGCDEEFYLEIVQMFLHDSEPMAEELRLHLEKRNNTAAVRLLHTLKGLAATVGAQELAALATQAENDLKSQPEDTNVAHWASDIRASINATVTLLQQVCNKINKLEPAPAHGIEPEVARMDTQALVAGLRQLDRLLRDSDMQATTVHRNLSRDRDPSLDDAFSALDSAMTALDFATARRHCMALTQRLTSS